MTSPISDLLPGLGDLLELLEPYRGAEAELLPVSDPQGRPLGNNGDLLMHSVLSRILQRLEIKMVARDRAQDAARGDVCIVPPNGAMIESYKFPGYLASTLRSRTSTPIIIFPSSAHFKTIDPSFMFQGRSAPTLWVLREVRSLHGLGDWQEGLRECGVTLHLDHDVVASGHEYVAEVFGAQGVRAETLLIAARTDGEARDPLKFSRASGARRFLSSLRRTLGENAPGTAIARWIHREELRTGGLRVLGPVKHSGHVAKDSGPAIYLDASSRRYATFARYLAEIAKAHTVVTDRLHVGLPAAVLGKRVILVEAGYHKLTGVYEHSLARVPGVSLVGGLPRVDTSG